jgi:hypothetical protein
VQPDVPPRITVKGADGITVVLRDARSGRTVQLSDATVGRYDVVAFFQPNVPTVVQTVELGSGSVVTVRCNASRCAVSQ